MSVDMIQQVMATLRDADRGEDAKPILDHFFASQLRLPVRDEAEIRAVIDLLAAREPQLLADAAQELNIPSHRLRRIAERCFGFPPKTLQTRSRFLRVFVRMLLSGNADYGQLPDSYYDSSHFLRDGNRFLGMTPRRFLAMGTPFLCAGLRAHASVLRASRAQPKAEGPSLPSLAAA